MQMRAKHRHSTHSLSPWLCISSPLTIWTLFDPFCPFLLKDNYKSRSVWHLDWVKEMLVRKIYSSIESQQFFFNMNNLKRRQWPPTRQPQRKVQNKALVWYLAFVRGCGPRGERVIGLIGAWAKLLTAYKTMQSHHRRKIESTRKICYISCSWESYTAPQNL